MDQSAFLDEEYYKGGKLTEAGQEFLTQMDTYKNGMLLTWRFQPNHFSPN